jgi:hypothetical protein
MKKLTLCLLLFSSAVAYSQDIIAPKKFSLRIGPTWGSFGWGGNATLHYSISKKVNVGLLGIYSSGKDFFFTDQQYYGGIRKTPITNVSISVNYFLLGNTNQNCRAALYVGLGLGYLQEINNTTYLYPRNLFVSNNPTGSYIERDITNGLAGNAKLGASFKIGPGKLYVEGYFSLSFLGDETTSFTFMNQFTNPSSPPKIQVNKYKEGFDPQAILCFNLGYAIPF